MSVDHTLGSAAAEEDGAGSPPRRTAAGRVLDVLGAFGHGHRSLTLSEISRRAGLPLSTTHRLAGELLGWGALERDEVGRYAVGLRLLELAALSPRGLGLREAAFTHLDDLHRAARGNVHLGVRDGHEVVYVEALRSRGTAQVSSRVGDRWPMHATGTGIVLLAHADRAVQDEALARPLPCYTRYTETDPRRLRAVMAAVRRDGFAVLHGQITEDAVAVAVPVRDRDGGTGAALSLVVRDEAPRVAGLVALLRATAARVAGVLETAHAVPGAPAGPARHAVRPVERHRPGAG